MLFNRKKKVSTYQEDNPDYKLQISLESLTWQHAENPIKQKAWEWLKKSSINNLFLENAIEKLNHRFKLGKYVYTVYPRRIERESKSIKCRTKHNPLYRISKPYKMIVDLAKQKQRIIKID